MGARNHKRRHLHSGLTLARRKSDVLRPTSEKLWLQVHRIERVDSLVIVGLDLTCKIMLVSLRWLGGHSRAQQCVASLTGCNAHPLGSPRDPYLRKP